MLMCCLPKHLATNWGQLRVLKRPEHVFSMIASVWDSTWRFSKTWTEFESLSLSEDWKSHWSKSSSLLFATADVSYMQSGFFSPFIYKKSFSSHSWAQSFIFYLFVYPFFFVALSWFFTQVKKDSVVSCVLDSEAVAWDHEKKQIQPFQVLTTRKRKVWTERDVMGKRKGK